MPPSNWGRSRVPPLGLRAMLTPSGQSLPQVGLALGAPGISSFGRGLAYPGRALSHCRPWRRLSSLLAASRSAPAAGGREGPRLQAGAWGSPIGWSRRSRTGDAIDWIFCRSSAALRGWPLACRSQLKLMYGDHHQQPQKDCRYDEQVTLLVVREPCMRMIGPVYGQPHLPCRPEPNTLSHILRFDDGAPGVWERTRLYCLKLAKTKPAAKPGADTVIAAPEGTGAGQAGAGGSQGAHCGA